MSLELGTLHHWCLGLGREGKSINLPDCKVMLDDLLPLLGLHSLDRGRVGGLVVLPDGGLLGLNLLLRQLS